MIVFKKSLYFCDRFKQTGLLYKQKFNNLNKQRLINKITIIFKYLFFNYLFLFQLT